MHDCIVFSSVATAASMRAHETRGSEGRTRITMSQEVRSMGSQSEDQAVQTGSTAGTLAGALSGAGLFVRVLPIPFVGPVAGAVVGGIVGGELGRRLAKAVVDGGESFVDSFKRSS